MTNQFYSWLFLVIPWLTLFFMKKQEVRQYMPAALFASLLTTIIHDAGVYYGFWQVLTPAPPLYEMLPYFYGLIPVLTLWIFKFSNGQVWRYVTINVVLDIGFAFFFLNVWLPSLNLYRLVGLTPLQVFLINLVHMSLLYAYQKWQEGEFSAAIEARTYSPRLEAAKPFSQPRKKNNQS